MAVAGIISRDGTKGATVGWIVRGGDRKRGRSSKTLADQIYVLAVNLGVGFQRRDGVEGVLRQHVDAEHCVHTAARFATGNVAGSEAVQHKSGKAVLGQEGRVRIQRIPD